MHAKSKQEMLWLEIALIVVVLGITCLLYKMHAYKMVVLNLFFIPVALSAFFLGRYRAGVTALFCFTAAVIVISMNLMVVETIRSPLVTSLAVLVWGATLGLNALVISNLSDETKAHQQEQFFRQTRGALIFGLAKLAEFRDQDTGLHLERISRYSKTLAEALRQHPKYRDTVTEELVDSIGTSAVLHDIGKVGIEDKILLKPGPLTESEREIMQKHPVIGAECLAKIELRLESSDFLEMAREIARYHHEHWNGCGYPEGLVKEEIPLAARIVAIADSYDALSSKRVYKQKLDHAVCVRIIRSSAGAQFDPDLVDVFLEIETSFERIASELQNDSDESGECDATDLENSVTADELGLVLTEAITTP